MKEGTDGFTITGSGVSDFFLDSFDEDFRAVLRERGDKGHIGRFADGQRGYILSF